jgi:pterin-4a-carbinolamine dehydratase
MDSDATRTTVEAAVAVLARTLDEPDRDRFLDALPGQVKGRLPVAESPRRLNQREFVQTVSLLGRQPPERARLRTQTVLAAIAERDPDLIDDLHIPDDLRELFDAPAPGGGVSGPTGHTAPLTADEVSAALASLPAWSGDTRELRRTIVLPPGDLDRVLGRVKQIARETGRGPEIRRGADGVVLALSTASVGAVTALDVDLAARLDELIDEIAPGMASP